jgi:hypothetical protein
MTRSSPLAVALLGALVLAAPAAAQDRDRLRELIEEAARAEAEQARGLDRTPAPKDKNEREVQRRYHSALRTQRVTLNFDGTPFVECLDFLRDVTGLNIVVTKGALEEVEKKAVKLKLKNITLRNVFELMLAQVSPDLRYAVKSGVLMVGLQDEFKQEAMTLELYFVGDLVHRPPDFKGPKMGMGKNGVTLDEEGED